MKHLTDFEIIDNLKTAAQHYATRFGPITIKGEEGRPMRTEVEATYFGQQRLTTETAGDLIPGSKGRGPIDRAARAEKRPPTTRARPPDTGDAEGIPDDAA